MLMNERHRVRERLRSLKGLPAGTAAQRTLWALAGDGTDWRRIADAIGSCPGVAARLLGLANSAFFGLSTPVTTLRDAIQILGLNLVRALTIALISQRQLGTAACTAFDEKRYWFASLLAASVCRQVSHKIKPANPDMGDTAFLAGLVHRLGMKALAHISPQMMNTVLTDAAERGTGLCNRERELLGMNHREAGAILLERWNAPHSLVLSTAHYGEADCGCEWQELCTIVGLASRWSESLLADTRMEDDPGMDRLGLTAADCSSLWELASARRAALQQLAGAMEHG